LHDARFVLGHAHQNLLRRLVLNRLRLDQPQPGQRQIVTFVLDDLRRHTPRTAWLLGARRPYPGDDYVLPFGVANVMQEGDELTIVTWGETVHRCLEAARDFGSRVEIIDLRTIVPWDKQAVLASTRKTSKCLIVHEDTWTGGFGAEIAATIAQEAFMDLDGPIVRLATSDQPIPYNPRLMEAVVPTMEKIQVEVERLLRF